MCFRKRFLISNFFPPVEGDTPSLSQPRSILRASNNNDLFFYNFVVKNFLSVNIYIQYSLTKYGFWGASEVKYAFSDFHFISIWGGGTPSLSPPPPRHFAPANEGFALVYYNSPPPPPPNPGVPSYHMAFWQKTRIITQKSLKWLRIH